VRSAIEDAAQYHKTLIITVHRTQTTARDRPGYPMQTFRQIVDAARASGLPVRTLSQLDTTFGVKGSNTVTVRPGEPPLITVRLAATPARRSGGFLA